MTRTSGCPIRTCPKLRGNRARVGTSAHKGAEPARAVVARIDALAEDPRPPGCEKPSGDEKYRVRQGDYRILYEIVDQALLVTVVKVGKRRDVYR